MLWLQAVAEDEDGKVRFILVSGGIYAMLGFLYPQITVGFCLITNVALALILMRGDDKHIEQLLAASWYVFKKAGFIFLLAFPGGLLIEGMVFGGELPDSDPRRHTIAVPILMIPGAILLTATVHWVTAKILKSVLS